MKRAYEIPTWAIVQAIAKRAEREAPSRQGPPRAADIEAPAARQINDGGH